MKLLISMVFFFSLNSFAQTYLSWSCMATSYLHDNGAKSYAKDYVFLSNSSVETKETVYEDINAKIEIANDDTTIFLSIKDKRPNGYTKITSAPLTSKSISLEINDAEKTGNPDKIISSLDIFCVAH